MYYDYDSSDYNYRYGGEDEGEYEEEEEEEEEEDVPDRELWRAVDVKHVRVAPRGGGAARTVLAAVAVVDAHLRVRFFSLARPTGTVLSAAGAPGLDAADLAAAPEAARVAAAAADALRGCMLVAHGAGLAMRLLGLSRDTLACVYDVNERRRFRRTAFRAAAARLGFSARAASPAYWPAPRVAAVLMQLACLSREEYDVAEYLERVLCFLRGRADHGDAASDDGDDDGDADEERVFYSFGELGNACAMPCELRVHYTYPRFFETHAAWCVELAADRGALRPRPLPWHVAPTAVAAAERAADAYEAQLVACLVGARDAGSGRVNVGWLGTCCPLPAADVGAPSLGAFLRARQTLFARSPCGNYVSLAARHAQPPAPPPPPPAAAAQQQEAAPPRIVVAVLQQPSQPPPVSRCCAVCMAAPKVGAFTPCMHKCCCMSCGEAVMRRTATCPICRTKADRFAYVYE